MCIHVPPSHIRRTRTVNETVYFSHYFRSHFFRLVKLYFEGALRSSREAVGWGETGNVRETCRIKVFATFFFLQQKELGDTRSLA